jgi:hypothetical protein
MKLPNIVGRKADNATVLAADTVFACQLQNNSLAHWQHGEREIARHNDAPWNVREKSHRLAISFHRKLYDPPQP